MCLSDDSDLILEHLPLLRVAIDCILVFSGVFACQAEAALITDALLIELHFLDDIEYILAFRGHGCLLSVRLVQQFHYQIHDVVLKSS